MAEPWEYVILVTDENLVVQGDPISIWSEMDITLKFNEPGAAIVTCPAEQWVLDQMVPGNRLVIIRQGVVVMAGPIEKWLLERSDDGENAGVGKLTINGSDDLALVAARVTYPDPAHTPDAQTLDNWVYTGNAELALYALVNTQAGPGALAARRIPHLTMGSPAGVGTSVTVKATRMQPLLDVGRLIGTAGGGLGFRTRQVGASILFEVYAPPDKSQTVRFSFGLGNLRYVGYEVSAPTATAVSVGGQGDTGAATFMIERTTATELASWGRYEKHVARDGTDTLVALQDDGDQALGEGAATTRLTTNTADTPDQQYGVHYQVGDIVAVESFPGQQFVDIVRTVHLQVYATSGEVVAAYVGSQEASTDPVWVQVLRGIDERLGRVEMTVLPA
jgi:hypothetical protein